MALFILSSFSSFLRLVSAHFSSFSDVYECKNAVNRWRFTGSKFNTKRTNKAQENQQRKNVESNDDCCSCIDYLHGFMSTPIFGISEGCAFCSEDHEMFRLFEDTPTIVNEHH